ncbi:MAG TPA: Glu-tRNA(Gln) amidotransferase subunit GatD, partial [Euryarchaeota archaeon]|nr:Glu-tRNA(Gln) amidotransferase subunit GatD [Euryarchaeota archaeon]
MYWGRAKEFLEERGFNVWDYVEVSTERQVFRGVIMPRTQLGDDQHLVIKLDNGYNIGVRISRIKEMKLIKREKKKRLKKEEKKYGKTIHETGGGYVSIVGTGGTIASKIDYETGAVKPSFKVSDILKRIPELREISEIKAEEIMNIPSEDMEPRNWVKIGEKVIQEIEGGAEGVVIAHGTDTMSYTSAALSFMIQDLNDPVVLVGSQRSSDRPSSDSDLNLMSSVRVAKTDLAEVAVVMHGSISDDFCLIHRGTRVRKMHTSRRDAFKTINDSPIGIVTEKGEVKFLSNYKKRSDSRGETWLDKEMEERVSLFKVHPGVSPEFLDFLVDKQRGIVIEGTGMGHVPK